MIKRTECAPQIPATSFSFSVLITSPIHNDVRFSPVSAMILPLGTINIQFATLLIAGIDLFLSFLFKRSLLHPPLLRRQNFEQPPLNLTLPQLAQLMQAAVSSRVPAPPQSFYPRYKEPGQDSGPVGADQPLFPDNLSVSLFVVAPFTPFNGSADTSFSVPLFEVPGTPGNLIISLGTIIAQFFIEKSEVTIPSDIENN